MITWKELTHDTPVSDIEIAVQHNLEELLKRINVIREAYGKPMTVTSGLRTMYKHKQIYAGINAKRARQGLKPLRIPMSSLHLSGKAVDIADPNRQLQKWIMKNLPLLEEVGLWMEDFSATATWVHFQIAPPKSGKRFFLP